MKFLVAIIISFSLLGCKKEKKINNDPIYLKMVGKWIECSTSQPASISFLKSGKVNMERILERNVSFWTNRIYNLQFTENIGGIDWNGYGFSDGKTSCSFYVNSGWDTICKYQLKIENSTSSKEYVFYVKE
jgi:hypothetical protein